MALRSPLPAFGPVFAHAMKVAPLTRNHNIWMEGLPLPLLSYAADALPAFQYFQPFGASGAGSGGTATGPWVSLGSVSLAMISPTPRAGSTRPLTWIGKPGASAGD